MPSRKTITHVLRMPTDKFHDDLVAASNAEMAKYYASGSNAKKKPTPSSILKDLTIKAYPNFWKRIENEFYMSFPKLK